MSCNYGETIEYLLHWYDNNARILPWRQDPLPYHVWISEIMLQQTRVEAVKGYYERFLEALPDVKDLAEVEEDRLFKLWEGLGYYTRARNLKKAAQVMAEKYGGEVPGDYTALLALPGIGSYTAGAIASIAFGIAEPAVDGNVLRVMKRIAGSFDDITKPSVKKELEQDIRAIMPKDRPGDYNQSLMELGATVCIPNGKPLCEKCPVMHLCRAFHTGTWQTIPVKSPAKKEKKIVERTIFVLKYKDRYAIRKREEKGLLHGLWELPGAEGQLTAGGAQEFLQTLGYDVESVEPLGPAKHIFSHIEWHMKGYLAELREEERAAVRYGEISPVIRRNVMEHADYGAEEANGLEKANGAKEADVRERAYSAKEADGAAGQEESNDAERSLAPDMGFRDLIFENASVIAEKYSLPSAFEAYKARIFAQERI